MALQRRQNQVIAPLDPSSSDVDAIVAVDTTAALRPPPIAQTRSSFFNGANSPVIDNGQFIGHQEIHHYVFNPPSFNPAGSSSEARPHPADDNQETSFNMSIQRTSPSRPSRILGALARIIRRRPRQRQILPGNAGPIERDVFQVYKRHLFPKGYGHPLWIPQCNMRLPVPYRQTGVTIGDVGIITREGAFDFLFNICLPRGHPINSLVPDDFEPLHPSISLDHNILEYREFSRGTYLASDDIRANQAHPNGIQFITSAPEGAILTMPRGAYVQRLANTDHFREYIEANAASWYRFINGQLMRGADNGDIRIVLGCHKSTAWGMATVLNTSQYASQSQTLRFGAFQPYHTYPTNISYFWEASGSVLAKVGPEPGDNDGLLENQAHELRNQCLFIRTTTVTLGESSWSRIAPKTPVSIKGEIDGSPRQDVIPQRAPTGISSIIPRNIDRRQSSIALQSDAPPLVSTMNHTKAINRLLLQQDPNLLVAISDDNEWCSVLGEDDPTQVTSSELFSRICYRNNIRKTSTGLVHFELKDSNPEKPPMLYTGREADDLLTTLKRGQTTIKQTLLTNLPDLEQLSQIIRLGYFSNANNSGTIPQEFPPFLMERSEDLFAFDKLLEYFQTEDSSLSPLELDHDTFTKSRLYQDLDSSSFPEAHRRRYLKALGDGAWKRYLQFDRLDDLDETIWSYEKAVSLTPTFTIQSLVPLFGLCSALYRRFILKRNLHDLVHFARYVRRQESIDLDDLVNQLPSVSTSSVTQAAEEVPESREQPMPLLKVRPASAENPLTPIENTRTLSTSIDLFAQLKEEYDSQPKDTAKKDQARENSAHPSQVESRFVDLLDLTRRWIGQEVAATSVLWLYGPSAMTMVSSLVQQLPYLGIEPHVGSIFTFSDKAAWNDEACQLFPAIAVELAYSIPGLLEQYRKIISREGSQELMTASLEIQFWNLIVDPIRKLPSKHTRTVIINAIDNCGYETARSILTLVTNALVVFKLPLRFIIASNRDTRIQDLFNRPSLSTISRQFFVGVQPTDASSPNAIKDPAEIMRRGFQTICEQHPSLTVPGGKKWPTEDVFNLLVLRSRKNPVYADTVISFLASIGDDPNANLQRVLEPTAPLRPAQELTAAFTDLDSLFTQILSTHRNRKILVHALGILLVLHDCAQPQTILQDIFGTQVGSYNAVLQVLRSLMHFPKVENDHHIHPWRVVKKNVPKKDQRVKSPFLVLALLSLSTTMPTAFTIPLAFRDRVHDSFYDFLVNPERSGPFYVDIPKHHGHLTMAGFACVLNYMWRPSRLDLRLGRYPTVSPETWDYLKFHLPDHYSQCPDTVREEIMEHLQDALKTVSNNDRDRTESDTILRDTDEFLGNVAVLIDMIVNDWDSFGEWSHFTSKHKYTDFRRVMGVIREDLFPRRSSLRLRKLSEKFRTSDSHYHHAHNHSTGGGGPSKDRNESKLPPGPLFPTKGTTSAPQPLHTGDISIPDNAEAIFLAATLQQVM